ncbi:cation diffusion facilitator family transporter [Acetobacter orientalis]|uniref:cation diffusion facilitator family transporter n=1 Tax=Acetobacter orientalis TaxID=146474 RepID=UPI0039EAEBC1
MVKPPSQQPRSPAETAHTTPCAHSAPTPATAAAVPQAHTHSPAAAHEAAHSHTHECGHASMPERANQEGGCTHDHDHDHDHENEHTQAGGCNHHHHGFGHQHVHTPASFGRAFAIGITLNVVYLAAEALWGVLSHSLALLADAGHNLSDVLALAAAWLAEVLSKRSPSARFTYGLRRSSILAALANAVILLLVTGGVAWESIGRLMAPTPVAGKTVMIVAAIGIVVNGATALLFASGQKNDLNIRGAFLHMLSDAVTSAAVVVAGGLVLATGLTWIDPAVSLAISVLVVLTTWGLLRDSLDLALDGVPRTVDYTKVEAYLRTVPGVADLHDLHIWPLSTTETAMTVHLVRTQTQPLAGTPEEAQTTLLHTVVEGLRTRFNIAHPTVQIEESTYMATCHLTDPHTV